MFDQIAPRAGFSYEEAFSRNLGWVTAGEQQMLRGKRIAIAGMGGVGGSHLITLARLGIGAFHIADFDQFEQANFNRQAGARMSSVGKLKADTLAAMARDINPELALKIFPQGVTDENLDEFLDGVDVYIDGLDFFVQDVRRKVFARCHERGIPCITAAPAGMGAAFLVFIPGGMSFEQWFRMEGLPKERQLVNFLVGLTPRGFQSAYLMDKSHLDLKAQRVPSTGLACELCAGVAAAQTLKLLLKRGPVYAAPWYHHFDAYSCKWKRGWMPGGNNNPLQRLKLALANKQLARLSQDTVPRSPVYDRPIEAILDYARWAPSGDNTQPWRFEILDDDKVRIQLFTAKARTVPDFYDFNNGQPTLLAGGALLETMRIAATKFGRTLSWVLEGESNGIFRIHVTLSPSTDVAPDPLATFIPIRSVNRYPYRLVSLSSTQKQALEISLGDSFTVTWRESFSERWASSRLNMLTTDIRLSVREAYETHKHVVDWKRNFSPTKIPVRALGIDRGTGMLMRWLMKDWRRLNFMNTYAKGTLTPQLEMDLLPGLLCSAHFILRAKPQAGVPGSPELHLRSGEALQRFWLTAASYGLSLQPATATLILASWGDSRTVFTTDAKALAKADRLAKRLIEKTGKGLSNITFMGRLGQSRSSRIAARSVRQPLELLFKDK